MYDFQTKSDAFLDINPLTKIVAFLVANILILGVKTYKVEIVFCILILFLGINGKLYKLSCKYTLFYAALILMDYFFKTNTNIIVSVIVLIARIIRMFFPIVFAAHILINSTSTGEFIASFNKIKLPAAFSVTFSVMMRFIPTVKEEINAIKQAMSYRGLCINFKSIICHPVLMIEHVLVPLLISSAHVMDELAAASMCRGLDTDVHRTSIYTVKFRLQDFSFIALLFLVLALAKGGWL